MSDPFSMTTDMRMLARIKIIMMTLTMLLDPQLGLFFLLEVLERERRKKGSEINSRNAGAH